MSGAGPLRNSISTTTFRRIQSFTQHNHSTACKTRIFRDVQRSLTWTFARSFTAAARRHSPLSQATLFSKYLQLDDRYRHYTTGSSSQVTSFVDPNRSDLFYHLLPPPTPRSSAVPVFALSFLPTPPPLPDSSTIIGWLPAESEGQEQEAGLNDFLENPNFLEILHDAVRAGLDEGVDDIQINGAMQLQEGWMHIHDARNVPALGRIGDPDDILGSVRVEQGKMLPDTYQPMPSYRLCTSDGLIQLTEGLAQKLKQILEDRARTELESSSA